MKVKQIFKPKFQGNLYTPYTLADFELKCNAILKVKNLFIAF